jgi:signal peptidase I
MKEERYTYMRLKNLIGIALLILVLGGCQNLSYTKAEFLGDSMEPNISDKDILYIDENYYDDHEVQHGDIISFVHNGDNTYVKRVYGLPGETIEIKNNRVVVDGVELGNEHILEVGGTITSSDFAPITVPDEMYFVLGDNIWISKDSRHYGFISKEEIIGKVMEIEHDDN